MSKKRNKNARKKVVRKRALANPRVEQSSQAPPPGWTPTPVEEEEEVVVDAVAAKEGGGAIDAIRRGVSPGRGPDGDTLLSKRRSIPELMVWLAGAAAVVWVVWKLVRHFNPPI